MTELGGGGWYSNVEIGLKALLNNVSTFKNSELRGPTYILSLSLIRGKN